MNREIFDLTVYFQMKYPEIYKNLLETPLYLNYDQSEISETELAEYRGYLMAQRLVCEKESFKKLLN